MRRDNIQDVRDAVRACREMQEFVEGYTLETYLQDDRTRSAIERLFEILGEALNRVDDADPFFREHLPESGRFISMKNHIRHEYDHVNSTELWNTIRDSIPDVQKKLNAWLEKNG